MSFTQSTLVNVLITGSSKVSRGAGAKVVPVDRVGVAVGALLTRVTDAGIVQLAQQTWYRDHKVNFIICGLSVTPSLLVLRTASTTRDFYISFSNGQKSLFSSRNIFDDVTSLY